MLAHLLGFAVKPSTASPAPDSFSSFPYVLLCAAGLPTDTCGHEEQHTSRERVRSCGATNASWRCCLARAGHPRHTLTKWGAARSSNVAACMGMHGDGHGFALTEPPPQRHTHALRCHRPCSPALGEVGVAMAGAAASGQFEVRWGGL